MLNIFRISSRVDEIEKAMQQLKLEFKFYKEELEKVDVKAMEIRRTYATKLRKLEKEEEKGAKEEENPFNKIILPEP